EICLQNDVLVISDEIHCDLVFNGAKFTAFATISDEFAQNSVICTAPSKTFNLAGLKTSNIIIPNPALRAPFAKRLEAAGIHGLNCFGAVAVQAAYNHGEEWLEAMLAYVEDNYHFMVSYLAEHLPQVRVIPLEGTYLAWCDFRALGLFPAERKRLIMEKANVYLDEGEMFGPEGEGFERFNLACPRSLLAEAVERIAAVMK
ncbi:MAG TPA: aminotransferase class I/II-fold pyridoxal phosphate-dependent enzyme, partial [Chloroflexi bacterium]|nr:aminotransferase class I/II-fold pyridoxal phosphate-dependent enzyme [Chloroflexota bacterium]